MFIWILILLFIWILISGTIKEGAKSKKGKVNLKKVGKTITKGVSKAANTVGGAISKVATSGMDSNTKKVLKNMRVIKKAIGGFIKKGGAYVSSPLPSKVEVVPKKCGI